MQRFLLLLIFVVLFSHSVLSADYYTAQNGADTNIGSETAPFRTIQKGASVIQPGDTLYIKEGVYNERVIPLQSGTANNTIIITAYLNDRVIVDGSGIPLNWSAIIDVTLKSNIIIDGLYVYNSSNWGIGGEGAGNIIIRNCYTSNTYSSGICAWNSSNIRITDNEVVLACNDGDEECITVAITADFIISNNTVHDSGPGNNGGEGIDVKDGSHNGTVCGNHVYNIPNRLGIYADAWDKHTYNIEIFNNTVHHTQNGFVTATENGGLLDTIKLYNNIAYSNQEFGYILAGWGITNASHAMRNIYVVNNTFAGNGKNTWGGGIWLFNTAATNIVICNNICSENKYSQICMESNPVSYSLEYNLIDTFQGNWSEVRGENYIEGSAGFINSAALNYHLTSNSIAISRGRTAHAPISDFDGVMRPQGSGYDIGAFEYNVCPLPIPAIVPNRTLLDNFEDKNEYTLIWDGEWSIDANTSAVISTNFSWAEPGVNGSDAAFRFDYDLTNGSWGASIGCDFNSERNVYDDYAGIRFKMRGKSDSVYLAFQTSLITNWNFFRTSNILPTTNWNTYVYSWSNLYPSQLPAATNIVDSLRACSGIEFDFAVNEHGWVAFDDFEFIPRDTTAPNIIITAPSGTVQNNVVISVSNTDGGIISAVHYQIDGTASENWSGMVFQPITGQWITQPAWDTTLLTRDGPHVIYVRAYDYFANSATIHKTVAVFNHPQLSAEEIGIGTIKEFRIENPVQSGMPIHCTKMPANFRVAVYNIFGELVYDAQGKDLSTLNGRWDEWKCVNNKGEPLAPGIYYVKVSIIASADNESKYRIIKLAVK